MRTYQKTTESRDGDARTSLLLEFIAILLFFFVLADVFVILTSGTPPSQYVIQWLVLESCCGVALLVQSRRPSSPVVGYILSILGATIALAASHMLITPREASISISIRWVELVGALLILGALKGLFNPRRMIILGAALVLSCTVAVQFIPFAQGFARGFVLASSNPAATWINGLIAKYTTRSNADVPVTAEFGSLIPEPGWVRLAISQEELESVFGKQTNPPVAILGHSESSVIAAVYVSDASGATGSELKEAITQFIHLVEDTCDSAPVETRMVIVARGGYDGEAQVLQCRATETYFYMIANWEFSSHVHGEYIVSVIGFGASESPDVLLDLLGR